MKECARGSPRRGTAPLSLSSPFGSGAVALLTLRYSVDKELGTFARAGPPMSRAALPPLRSLCALIMHPPCFDSKRKK